MMIYDLSMHPVLGLIYFYLFVIVLLCAISDYGYQVYDSVSKFREAKYKQGIFPVLYTASYFLFCLHWYSNDYHWLSAILGLYAYVLMSTTIMAMLMVLETLYPEKIRHQHRLGYVYYLSLFGMLMYLLAPIEIGTAAPGLIKHGLLVSSMNFIICVLYCRTHEV